MAARCRILASRIPWTEEPGGLQSTVSQRVGPDLRDLARTTHSPVTEGEPESQEVRGRSWTQLEQSELGANAAPVAESAGTLSHVPQSGSPLGPGGGQLGAMKWGLGAADKALKMIMAPR